MPDGSVNIEGFTREKALFRYNPKGDEGSVKQVVSSETPKRIDRPSPDGAPYTNVEKMLAGILPSPDKLVPVEDVTYEKRVATFPGHDSIERQVGYSVTEVKGTDYSTDDVITLVGFHGAMGSDEVFQNLVRMYKDKKIRLISVSAPLHGDTFNPKGEVSFANWMEEYVVPLLGKEKAENIISMGSSMGGLEALWLAKLVPDKIIGCIADNPLITPADNVETSKVLMAMAKEGLVFKKEKGQKGREQFYSGRYEVEKKSDFNAMRILPEQGITGGLIEKIKRLPGFLRETGRILSEDKWLINFLGTIPQNESDSASFIGDFKEMAKNRDPEFFVFTGRRDQATWAHKRREDIDMAIRRIKEKVYGINLPEDHPKLYGVAIFKSFKGGHLNGFDRPWEYYSAHYNAINIIIDRFQETKALAS